MKLTHFEQTVPLFSCCKYCTLLTRLRCSWVRAFHQAVTIKLMGTVQGKKMTLDGFIEEDQLGENVEEEHSPHQDVAGRQLVGFAQAEREARLEKERDEAQQRAAELEAQVVEERKKAAEAEEALAAAQKWALAKANSHSEELQQGKERKKMAELEQGRQDALERAEMDAEMEAEACRLQESAELAQVHVQDLATRLERDREEEKERLAHLEQDRRDEDTRRAKRKEEREVARKKVQGEADKGRANRKRRQKGGRAADSPGSEAGRSRGEKENCAPR